MLAGIKPYPYETHLSSEQITAFRSLYNLSNTNPTEAKQVALKLSQPDLKLFRQYRLDVNAYLKSLSARKAESDAKLEASSAKIEELKAARKILEDEAKAHLDAAAKQDVIIADVRRQQDALATQFATKMNLGSKQAAPAAVATTNPHTSTATKKLVV